MGRKKREVSEYQQVIDLLLELKGVYLNQSMGWHLSLALSDYSDISNLSDKELLFALNKYKSERELDILSSSSLRFPEPSEEEALKMFGGTGKLYKGEEYIEDDSEEDEDEDENGNEIFLGI
jgi:hypothetical protein